MHSGLKPLAVRDDFALKSRWRLLRVYLGKHLSFILASIFCLGASAAASMELGGMILGVLHGRIPNEQMPEGALIGFSAFLCLAIAVLLAMAFAFSRGAWTDPIAGYLRRPEDFGFAEALIVRSQYHPREKGRSFVRATIRSEEIGVELSEEFKAWAWSFTTRDEDEGSRPGDDVYEIRGKRPRLPLPAWVLHRRAAPADACLAGIPAEIVDRARRVQG